MIHHADASTDEGTMVIHFDDTLATDGTVMGSRRFYLIANLAELVSIERLHWQDHEWIEIGWTGFYNDGG